VSRGATAAAAPVKLLGVAIWLRPYLANRSLWLDGLGARPAEPA
jgi:hypothetical protein